MSDIYYRHAHRSQKEIDNTSKRYGLFDASLIPRIFLTSLGLHAVSWKRPDSYGTMHVNYYVTVKEQEKPLMLRANTHVPGPEVTMKIEQLITEKVKAIGVPVNTILFVDISRKKFPFDFQIQEVLLGEDLEDHFSGTKEAYDQMSFVLGSWVAKFGAIQFEKFGLFDENEVKRNILIGTKGTCYEYITTRLDEDILFLVDNTFISRIIGEKIRNLFEEYKPVMDVVKGSLVHHDLADHNFMYKDGMITGIFDWENAVIGDPMLDLASCPTWKTHYPREEKLVAGYTSVLPLPDHFIEKINIYRLRTLLWKMVFAVRANILNAQRKQRFADALEPFGLTIAS